VEKTENIDAASLSTFRERVTTFDEALEGVDLQDAALALCDEFTTLSFRDFVFSQQAELTAPLFKRPEMLRYIERLQAHLELNPVVGKTASAVDALSKGAYELSYVQPPADATELEREEYAVRNEAHRGVPSSA